jgi:hypothetical protein
MLAVLSGIGRGGLAGAAPAYLQTQAAEQSADIAHKRRMNEQYGDVEAKQRAEAAKRAENIGGIYNTEYKTTGEMASQQAVEQKRGQTTFANTAAENANRLKQINLEHQKRLEEAKARAADEQELARIKNDYDLKRDEINKKAQLDLQKYIQSATPAETRAFNDYYKNVWSKNPANKDRPITDAYREMYSDKYAGHLAGLEMTSEDKRAKLAAEDYEYANLRRKIAKETDPAKIQALQQQIDAKEKMYKITPDASKGLGSLPTGSSQLPPGFVPDKPVR